MGVGRWEWGTKRGGEGGSEGGREREENEGRRERGRQRMWGGGSKKGRERRGEREREKWRQRNGDRDSVGETEKECVVCLLERGEKEREIKTQFKVKLTYKNWQAEAKPATTDYFNPQFKGGGGG